MKQNKFLILIFYFERPEVVKNALTSIKNITYPNYEVHFIDDGSIARGEPVVREFCPEIIDKFKFTYIDDTIETKKQRGGSIFGKFANEAMMESDADHVIPVCDDDAIYPNFLNSLNEFLNKPENSTKNYFYHNIVMYNCLVEGYYDAVRKCDLNYFTNQHKSPINCAGRVDSSQVTFNRKKFLDDGIRYPHPRTASLDYVIFGQMYNTWGPGYYSGLISQCKSNNEHNLIWREQRAQQYDVVDKK